ncbi:hypothetical protein FOL47_002632 [Perkinsus chesapeaki]|uniref:Uncharacterized protein n=1 Tax=Perkinsus chesapeaki TaxID=330153 RepID=A0A7J6MCD9_PERCH|nr:hypothetical protein FOL47_002632 [Perkinsus chesapeaki]
MASIAGIVDEEGRVVLQLTDRSKSSRLNAEYLTYIDSGARSIHMPGGSMIAETMINLAKKAMDEAGLDTKAELATPASNGRWLVAKSMVEFLPRKKLVMGAGLDVPVYIEPEHYAVCGEDSK